MKRKTMIKHGSLIASLVMVATMAFSVRGVAQTQAPEGVPKESWTKLDTYLQEGFAKIAEGPLCKIDTVNNRLSVMRDLSAVSDDCADFTIDVKQYQCETGMCFVSSFQNAVQVLEGRDKVMISSVDRNSVWIAKPAPKSTPPESLSSLLRNSEGCSTTIYGNVVLVR